MVKTVNLSTVIARSASVLLFIYCQICISAFSGAAPPKVVVSIAPIHSLVANVMQGIGEPELLLEGSQSPHHFSLRPSQLKQIKEADLIIWVGDILETFLVKPIQSFDKHACMLIKAPNLRLLTLRGKPCGGGMSGYGADRPAYLVGYR